MVINLSTILAKASSWLQTTVPQAESLPDLLDYVMIIDSGDISKTEKSMAINNLIRLITRLQGGQDSVIIQHRDTLTFQISAKIEDYGGYGSARVCYYYVSDDNGQLSAFEWARCGYDMSDPDFDRCDPIIKSINGTSVNLAALCMSLIEQYATNAVIAAALDIIAVSSPPIDQLITRLEIDGYHITNEARKVISDIYACTYNLTAPRNMLHVLKSWYDDVMSARDDGDSIVFQMQTFTIHSIASALVSSTLSTVAGIAAALTSYAINPLLGIITSGFISLFGSVKQHMSESVYGAFNPGSRNCAAPLTLYLNDALILDPTVSVNDELISTVQRYGYAVLSDTYWNAYLTRSPRVNGTYQMLVIPEMVGTFYNYALEGTLGEEINQAMSQGEHDYSNPFTVHLHDEVNIQLAFSIDVESLGQLHQMRKAKVAYPQDYESALRSVALTTAYTYYDLFGLPQGNIAVMISNPEVQTWANEIHEADYLIGKSFFDVMDDLRRLSNYLLGVGAGLLAIDETSGGLLWSLTNSFPYRNGIFGNYATPAGSYSTTTALTIETFWNLIKDMYTIMNILLNGSNNSQLSGNDILRCSNQGYIIGETYVINNPVMFNSYDEVMIMPPSISINSIKTTLGVMAGVAATAGLVYAGSRYILRQHILPKMNLKYNELALKRSTYQSKEYIENTSYAQRLADQRALDKATRRYNLLAKLTGSSTLSLVSGWETGNGKNSALGHVSEGKSDSSTELLNYYNGIYQNAQLAEGSGYTTDSVVTVTDIMRLIKPVRENE